MKSYPTYKPTGIAWLPQLPEHWNLVRGKNLYQKMQRSVNDTDEVVTCFRDGTVTLRKNRRTKGFTESLKEFGYQGIRKGDLVIHVMDAFAGAIGVSDSDGKGTPVYSVCQAKGNSNNQYYAFLLREMARSGFIQSLYRGIRERSSDFRFEVFASQFYPVPPRDEQDQIVRFLDWKMARINNLIIIKKKQIVILKELKNYYISKAVTNGVDGNGIIADKCINHQWNRVKIGYKAWIRARLGWRGLKSTEYVEKGYPFLSAFNIIDDKLLWENLNFINKYRYDESPEIKLSIGDILLVKDGAGIGKCARIDALPFGESTTNGSLAVITPSKDFSYKYLHYYLISNDFNNATNRIITGMGVPHLTQHFLKNVEIPCPPFEQQEAIVEYLDYECQKLDSIKAIKNSEINKLKELRIRLISDVVTGKIDVRGIEVPEYEFIAEESPDDADASEDEMGSEVEEN